MKQVIQNFKSGELYVDEVPTPSLSERMVLVKNKFSLISAGTERGTVKVGKASLIGKAKARPDLVAQVLQNVKKEGLKATIDKVQTKLDSLKALGYSTSGIVQASMDSDGKFRPGDRVACAGQDYASHAQLVSIPQNLVAKIPSNVTFEEASFTTVGAIALQGIRQAEPHIGENICVIGLGLIGQITCQLLKANGCNVFGIDLSQELVTLAEKVCADVAMNRKDQNLLTLIQNFTGGHGFDSIIITAAAPTNDPIELAAEIARKRGKVIVVGAVKMDVPRDPHFYRKELDLRMSCSYGPGRYDASYEEDGNDYPYAYVRWTEQRNMEAFLQLISNGAINLEPLITHKFEISNAEMAYDLVLGKNEEFHVGILLGYPEEEFGQVLSSNVIIRNDPSEDINVGFIGAGSFAQNYLIPNVKNWGGALEIVVTSKGITSKNVAQKFEFNVASAGSEYVLNDKKINTIFIATHHNSHAKYVIECLNAGKNVFVEKPLAMNIEDLEAIKNSFYENPKCIMVGYNRRFAPIVNAIKSEFKNVGEALIMNFRINAGFIPKDHWTQNKRVGGGRIIGEMCHFIDLMQHFSDSYPIKVYADCIETDNSEIKADDNIAITIKFEDGSVGNLVYVANGDKAMPKERIEIFGGGIIGIINDFRGGEIYKGGKRHRLKLSGKGHKEEVYAYLDSIRNGTSPPIPFNSIYLTTLATFKVIDSLTTGIPQRL